MNTALVIIGFVAAAIAYIILPAIVLIKTDL